MSKLLRNGSHGCEVVAIQRALNRRLSPPIKVDGIFGSKTEAAVRRFQKAVGFPRKEIDGLVGPKTTVALFQIFDMKITADLKPKDSNAAPTSPSQTPANKPADPPRTVPASETKPGDSKEELPQRFQLSAQVGFQDSSRDGPGVQVALGATFRSRDYFPNSGPNTIYHGTHLEIGLSPSLGIPLPPSSIYTGQLGVTISPVTDWFVLRDRLHLFTPSFNVFGQIPLNHPNVTPPVDDPSSHPRLGGAVGLELFHFDIIKDRLSIGISGQESGYWDFQDRRVIWDPSFLGFLQGTFGAGPRYKPLPNP
jgi:hypothetical protein